MDDRLLLFLVLFPLLSAAGIGFVWIGLSGMREARRRAERERARATGTVVDLVKRFSLGRGKPLVSIHPVVAFRADGRDLRHESPAGYSPGQFQVGESVDILYDADDPSRFHLEKLVESHAAGDRITVAVGLVWIAAAWVVTWLVSR